MTQLSLSLVSSCPLCSFSSSLSSPLTCPLFCSQCDSFSQSVKPHGQIGVPPCQVGFRKHSSCCLVWAPCVGAVEAAPLSCAHKHRKPHSDRHDMDIHYCGPLFRGLDAHKKPTNIKAGVTTKQHQHEKRKCAPSLPLWLRCVSREALRISIYFLCCFNHVITNEKEMLTQSKDSFMKQIARGRRNELYTRQY